MFYVKYKIKWAPIVMEIIKEIYWERKLKEYTTSPQMKLNFDEPCYTTKK